MEANRMGVTLLLLMLPLGDAADANLAPMDNGAGGCVYTFHAWVPSQDILKRVRDLEYKCSNSTHEWERYIGNMRAQVLEEMLSHKNITYHVERQLLEQEMADVQLKIAIKDLRLELVDIRNEESELRALIDEVDLSEGHRLRHKVSNSDFQSVKGEMQGLDHSVGQLKNNVGDLKAEWLLIKREVQNIQTDNQELHREQDSIREETGKMKRIVDEVQTDTVMLKRQHEEMRSVNEKMSRGLSEIRNREYPRGQIQPDDNEAHERFSRQMTDLKNQNMVLQSQIERIREENQQMKKEVLSAAVSSRNGSVDGLGVWLRKLPDAHPLGFTGGHKKRKDHPRDCHEVYETGFRTSGVYQIKPRGASQLDNAYCEMINNTGWTLVQRRVDGTLGFDRGWMEYKFGFGNLYGEFWLGTELIHQLTSQKQCRVRVDIWDWEGGRFYAEYSYFKVDSEKDKYTLHVRGYDGTAGDSLSYHDEMEFSTVDSDNDLHVRNCAEDNKSGWWFNSCYTANMNGVYHSGWYSHQQQTFADGIAWFTVKKSEFYSLKKVEIKIRPTYL